MSVSKKLLHFSARVSTVSCVCSCSLSDHLVMKRMFSNSFRLLIELNMFQRTFIGHSDSWALGYRLAKNCCAVSEKFMYQR